MRIFILSVVICTLFGCANDTCTEKLQFIEDLNQCFIHRDCNIGRNDIEKYGRDLSFVRQNCGKPR